MNPRFAPVPVLKNELLQEMQVGGVRVTESWHKASSTIPLHAHRWATVTVLIDGSFEETYKLRSSMACVAPAVHVRPPGEPHVDRLGNIGAHNVVLEIDDTTLESVKRHSALFEEIRHLRSSELASLAGRLRQELLIDDPATPMALQGLAMELFATASRGTSRALTQPAPWLQRVRDKLHDCFRESDFGLAELSVIADVHPVHLARAFRATYGASPGEYLRRLRVHWAADQLRTTRRPIVDIAIDAGFADQSHFTRAFRAAFGSPPGAWRRAQQGSV